MGGPVGLFRSYNGSERYSPCGRREAARQTRRALKAEAKRIVDEENENRNITLLEFQAQDSFIDEFVNPTFDPFEKTVDEGSFYDEW